MHGRFRHRRDRPRVARPPESNYRMPGFRRGGCLRKTPKSAPQGAAPRLSPGPLPRPFALNGGRRCGRRAWPLSRKRRPPAAEAAERAGKRPHPSARQEGNAGRQIPARRLGHLETFRGSSRPDFRTGSRPAKGLRPRSAGVAPRLARTSTSAFREAPAATSLPVHLFLCTGSFRWRFPVDRSGAVAFPPRRKKKASLLPGVRLRDAPSQAPPDSPERLLDAAGAPGRRLSKMTTGPSAVAASRFTGVRQRGNLHGAASRSTKRSGSASARPLPCRPPSPTFLVQMGKAISDNLQTFRGSSRPDFRTGSRPAKGLRPRSAALRPASRGRRRAHSGKRLPRHLFLYISSCAPAVSAGASR